MGQLILCKSPRAKAPFYIESGKVNIYSLEELMYFVQSVRFVARDDFMKPEFIDWVEKEIGMKELAEMLREKLLIRLPVRSGLAIRAGLRLINCPKKEMQMQLYFQKRILQILLMISASVG